jgi:hypothetical protein
VSYLDNHLLFKAQIIGFKNANYLVRYQNFVNDKNYTFETEIMQSMIVH